MGKFIKLVLYCWCIMVISSFIGVFTYGLFSYFVASYNREMALDWISLFIGFGLLFFTKKLKEYYPKIADKYFVGVIIITGIALLKLIVFHF